MEVALRLVTATNRNLEELVQTGRFRSDLYYRVSVAAMSLPPLREIKSDIPLLADHFRQLFAQEFKKKVGDTMLQEWLPKAGAEGQAVIDAYKKM